MNYIQILQTFEPKRHNLLNCLHQIQNASENNCLNEEALNNVAIYFSISKAEVNGVIGFYSMFRKNEQGKYVITLCESLVCEMMPDFDLKKYLQEKLNISVNEVSKDGLFSIQTSECLGRCDQAPVMSINHEYFGNLTKDKIDALILKLSNG